MNGREALEMAHAALNSPVTLTVEWRQVAALEAIAYALIAIAERQPWRSNDEGGDR